MNKSTVMDSARDAAAASDTVILPRLWATLREPPPGWLCPIKFKLGVGKAFEGPFAESFKPSDETEKLLVQASQLLERLEPGATSRTDATVSGTIDDLLPSSWSVHRRSLCNRLLHRKRWWKLCSYCFGSCMHVWCDKPRGCHGLWHDRRFASQQLEHSSEEPMQQATTQETLVEALQLLLWFMYACVVRQAAWMPRSLARSTICFPAVGAFIRGAYATGYYTGNVGGSFAATALVHVCMCGLVIFGSQVSSFIICDPLSENLAHCAFYENRDNTGNQYTNV